MLVITSTRCECEFAVSMLLTLCDCLFVYLRIVFMLLTFCDWLPGYSTRRSHLRLLPHEALRYAPFSLTILALKFLDEHLWAGFHCFSAAICLWLYVSISIFEFLLPNVWIFERLEQFLTNMLAENFTIVACADGCSWGPKPRRAAEVLILR